jgi:hypothetical protein
VSGEGLRPVIGSVQEPLQDLGVTGTLCMSFFVLSMGDVPRGISYALSTLDAPLVGPTGPLAMG